MPGFDPRAEGFELDFSDRKPIRVPVKYGGKRYVLKEASADVAIRYHNASHQKRTYQDGKLVGFKDGLFDLEPIAVSSCLVEVGEGGGETAVPVTTIRSWPCEIQEKLFETLKEISPGLVAVETEESLRADLARLQKRLSQLMAERLERGNGEAESPLESTRTSSS